MRLLDRDEVALFLREHCGELTRIWREARSIARPNVFPGLLDGVVESFFDACGEVLGDEGEPNEVWPRLRGLVRWPHTRAQEEVHKEWILVSEVLMAAIDAIHCDSGSRAWLRAAASDGRYGMASLVHGLERSPPGVLVALLYSAYVIPRRMRQENGRTDA